MALISQSKRTAPRNAVRNVQRIPSPPSPKMPRIAPPIKPPTIPMTMFPRIPSLSPWIKRSASAPARPPITIQTIHAQSVPRTLAMTSASIIFFFSPSDVRVLGHGPKCVSRQRHALLLHCGQGCSRCLAEDRRRMMSTTMTSEEQRAVKQQILAAFEHGSSVSNLLSTTPVPLHRATVYRLHQRLQTDPETALVDGRKGHPSKFRGEVRTWLETFCRATPDCTSCTVQTA